VSNADEAEEVWRKMQEDIPYTGPVS